MLELVAFGPGYLNLPNGQRRLAHWAEFASYHVGAFLLALGIGIVYSRSWEVAMIVLVALVFALARAWLTFHVDRSIPLGEDNRQTLYLVAKRVFFGDWEFEGSIIRGMYGRVQRVQVWREEQYLQAKLQNRHE